MAHSTDQVVDIILEVAKATLS